MTVTEEITLPGYMSDVHTFGYQLANLSPVPGELRLYNYGFELIKPEICYSHIFQMVVLSRCIEIYKKRLRAWKSTQKKMLKHG
jgi:hypothetical protein